MKKILNENVNAGSYKAIKKLTGEVSHRVASLNPDFTFNTAAPFCGALHRLYSFINIYHVIIPKSMQSQEEIEKILKCSEKFLAYNNFKNTLEEYASNYPHLQSYADEMLEQFESINLESHNLPSLDQLQQNWEKTSKNILKRVKPLKKKPTTANFGRYTRHIISTHLYQFSLQFEAAKNKHFNRRLHYAGLTLHHVLNLMELYKKCSKRILNSIYILKELQTIFDDMERLSHFLDSLAHITTNTTVRNTMIKHEPIDIDDDLYKISSDLDVAIMQFHNLALKEIDEEIVNANHYYINRLSSALSDINQSIIKIR